MKQAIVNVLIVFFQVCSASVVGATIWKYENDLRLRKVLLGKVVENHYAKLRDFNRDDSALGQLRQWFHSTNDAFKIFASICAVNVAVFCAWKIPSLRPTMMRYFVTSCEQNQIRLLPMILSNFSHSSPVHLGLNMFVLYSFTNLSVSTIGEENYCSLYLAAGCVSSFTSYCFKIFSGALMPSLGAVSFVHVFLHNFIMLTFS